MRKCLVSVCVAALGAQAGHFSSVDFPSGAMNDGNVGLSTNHHYPVAVDIIGAGTTVNGVAFTGSGTAVSGAGWSLAGAGTLYPSGGNKANVTGNLTNLFNGFQYGGNPATLSLSNLVAGETYVVSFYNQTWGGPRLLRVTGSGGGATLYLQDPGGGSILRYTFLATNATESLVFALANIGVNTFHFYDFAERSVFNAQWNVAGGGSYNDAAKWSRLDPGTPFGVPDGQGLSAAFPAIGAPAAVTFDAHTTVGHLRFGGADGWTLLSTNGSGLTLHAEPGGVSVLHVPAGAHSLAVPVTLNNMAVKLGDGELALNGPLNGSGGIVLSRGVLALNATNGHSGSTTVSGGTLQVPFAEALSPPSVLAVDAPGLVALSNPTPAVVIALAIDGHLQPAGTWGGPGSGAQYTSAAFSGPGTIIVLSGLADAGSSWNVNDGGMWGDTNNWFAATVAYGTNQTAYFTNAINADRGVTNLYAPLPIGQLVFGSPQNNWILSGQPVEMAVSAGTPVIAVQTNTATMAAQLAGVQGLQKAGDGTLVLTGTNTYGGGTVISGGRLQLGNNGTSGSIAGDVVADGALVFARTDTQTFAGVISGSGLVWQAGSGMTTLSATNAFNGRVLLAGGTLAVGEAANLGQVSVPLSFSGGVLRLVNTGWNNLADRPVNWSTFNGGFDIASAGESIALTNPVGNVNAAGTLSKFGAGSLYVSNGVVKQMVLMHQGTTVVDSAGTVTATTYASVGQLAPTNSTLVMRGSGRFVSSGDLNIGDLSGSTGFLSVVDAANVFARQLYVGKSGSAAGVVTLSGGSIQSTAGGDWRVGGGTSTNDSAAYGYIRQSGGLFFNQNNCQIGAYGLAQYDLLAGTHSNAVAAPVTARYPGSRGVFNVLGGSFSAGWGYLVGEQGVGVLNIANAGFNVAAGGNGFAIGGWQANGDVGTGTVNLAAGALVTAQFVRKGATNASSASLNFDGGTLRAAINTASFLQGLDNALVWTGGATLDSAAFNITVAQPLRAPAGNGVFSIPVSAGGAGYIGPPLVVVSGGGGSGATAYAQIDAAAGTVTNLVVTSAGENFVSPPAVTLLGGGGSGASAGTPVLAATASGSLTKLGAGTLTLNGTNTHTGGTIVGAGIVLVGNSNALGTGTVYVATNTAGIGSAAALDQAFITWLSGRLSPASAAGVLALGAGTSNAIDLTPLTNWVLGAANGNWVFAGSLLNAGTNLYLGGGNGTLNYLPTLGTGTNLFVGRPGQSPAGTVQLSGTNTAYASAITVQGGTLRGGRTNAFGGASATVTVEEGAGLDIAGVPLGAVQVHVRGTGPNTNGAILNTGGDQLNALQRVTLTGPASFGGAARWDLRGGTPFLDLAGFTLTKTGTSYIALVGGSMSDGDVSIAQGTFSIEAGAVVTAGTGRITVQAPGTLNFYGSPSPVMLRAVTVTGGVVSINGGGSATIGAPFTLAGATNTFNVSLGTTLTLTGLVEGAGGLVKTGAGVLLVSNATALAGAVVVTQGILEAGTPAPAGVFGGVSAVAVGGSGGLQVNGTNVLFGATPRPVTVTTGGVLLNGADASVRLAFPLTLAGGNLGGTSPDAVHGNWRIESNITATGNASIVAPRVQLARPGGVVLDVVSNASLAVSATLEDAAGGPTGSLVKTGPGTLVLGGASTFTGPTIVSNGALRYANALPPGLVGRWLFNGSTADVSGNGFNATINGAGASYAPGRFGQGLQMTGSQRVDVAYNAAFSLTNFTVSTWIYLTNHPGTGASYALMGTRVGGDNTFDYKVRNLNGVMQIHGDIGNGTVWINTAADAPATLSLYCWHQVAYCVGSTNFAVYVDGVNVGGGSYTSAVPLFMKSGQTLLLGDSNGAEKLRGIIDDAMVFNRVLSAAEMAQLYVAGNPASTNVLPAATTVRLAAGASWELYGARQAIAGLADVDGAGGLVTNSGGWAAQLVLGADAQENEFPGSIGDGPALLSLVKAGSGTQTLSGVVAHHGGTIVSGGLLRVNGAFTGTGGVEVAGGTLGGSGYIFTTVTNLSGTVAPGASPGTLSIMMDYLQLGTLEIEIAGLAPGSGHDVLAVGGTAFLAGPLVVLTNGYTPVAGNSFTVLTASAVGGTFSGATLPALGPGLGWNLQYLPGAVVLSVTGAPPPTGYDLAATVITNGLTGYQDDADGDGYANLLEYVTGGSLTNAGIEAKMQGARTNGLLALRFTRNTNAVDATLIVEGSSSAANGATWLGIATNIGGSWGAATNVISAGTNSPLAETVYDATEGTNRFLRLRVTRP